MATSNSAQTGRVGAKLYVAEGTILDGQIVKRGTASGSVLAAGAGEGFGVAVTAGVTGNTISVVENASFGMLYVIVGAGWSSQTDFNIPFKSDASGYAIPATTNKDRVLGWISPDSTMGTSLTSGNFCGATVQPFTYTV